jgi:hypothetical protein
MENFSTLSASVSGGIVTLSFTLVAETARYTPPIVVQRSPYGSDAWATVSESNPVVTPPSIRGTFTWTETPAAGQWSYRVLITVNGSALESNIVDVTTQATTGVLTLTGTVTTPSNLDVSGPTGFKLISLSWTLDTQGVLKYLVQRSLDGGVTWRDDVVTSQLRHDESLPAGTGSVQYRVLASLPNVGTGNQLNLAVISTSNVATLSV